MQFTMLFVSLDQFVASIHVSYRESGTIISLLDGVLVNADVPLKLGTVFALLKSNIVKDEQL